MKASNLTPDRNISFLFKGPFGHGKTLAACSFALAGPLYLAYWDKNKPIELLMFFNRFGELGKKILDNIEYDVYGSHNAHQYLNRLIQFSGDCRESTIVTDSVTNMTAGAVNWSLGFRDTSKGAKKDKLNKEAPQMIPDFDEYKIETSLVTQSLDISRTLPCNIIWCAHPLPTLKMEGSGASMKVSKAVSIVTYGSKVAGMVPGSFTEIYHFSKRTNWNAEGGSHTERFTADVRGIGDDFGKTALFDEEIKEIDFTNRFFYEVWKETLDKQMGEEPKPINQSNVINPFTPKTNRWS